jgi:hypothetical protein
MRIRFTFVTWILEKWYSLATIRKENKMNYYFIYYIYYIVFVINYSSDTPSSLINELATSSNIQSVCLVGKGRLKERCRLDSRIYDIMTSCRLHLVVLLSSVLFVASFELQFVPICHFPPCKLPIYTWNNNLCWEQKQKLKHKQNNFK